MTLTCNPRRHPHIDDAFRRSSIAVNQLFKRIRRRWPSATVEYFLVWERTKAGWPHAHLLLRAPFIPQAWLSNVWSELTGAPIVDIRQVHTPGQVAAYIAKYLSKDPQAPQGMKRFRHSRKFFGPIIDHTGPHALEIRYWMVSKSTALDVARQLSRDGFSVASHPDGSFTAYTPSDPRGRQLSTLLSDRKLLQEAS